MQLDNILFTSTATMALGCLLVALMAIRFKAITLRSFQAIYLLLGAANIAICYYNGVDILKPIIALAAGIILTFIAAGLFGRSETSSHYETLLVGVGLFPWYLGFQTSLVYAGVAIIFCGLLKLGKSAYAMQSLYWPVKTIFNASKRLPEEKLFKYREKSFVYFTAPVGFASILAVLFYSIQF